MDKSGVFVGLAFRSKLFRQLAVDERLAKVLHQIMGDHVLFLSDKVAYKNAKTNFASPWHQDWPYWEGSHKISVWIALERPLLQTDVYELFQGHTC